MEGQWKFCGDGGLKSQNFKRKVSGLTGNSRGVGGFKSKTLPWVGYGYFLEQLITSQGPLLYFFFKNQITIFMQNDYELKDVMIVF